MQATAISSLRSNDPAMAAAVSLLDTYVATNPGVSGADALAMLGSFYESLSRLTAAAPADAPAAVEAITAALSEAPPRPERPAVPVGESVAADGSYIVCLEDGARLKMLKRYLRRFNLTPEAYRERWGLPGDYPMTAPAYSARKQAEAKAVGLGTALNKRGLNVGQLELAPAA